MIFEISRFKIANVVIHPYDLIPSLGFTKMLLSFILLNRRANHKEANMV